MSFKQIEIDYEKKKTKKDSGGDVITTSSPVNTPLVPNNLSKMA